MRKFDVHSAPFDLLSYLKPILIVVAINAIPSMPSLLRWIMKVSYCNFVRKLITAIINPKNPVDGGASATFTLRTLRIKINRELTEKP